jgi:hypothetical protein
LGSKRIFVLLTKKQNAHFLDSNSQPGSKQISDIFAPTEQRCIGIIGWKWEECIIMRGEGRAVLVLTFIQCYFTLREYTKISIFQS